MKLINIVQAGPLDTAPPLSSLIENVLQFIVSIIGGIAILTIVIAGIMYMISAGDTKRVQTAKKALIAGIVGLAIAILSFMIVSTIIGLV